MTPLLRPVWWLAQSGSFSRTVTWPPGRSASSRSATARPRMPPPTTDIPLVISPRLSLMANPCCSQATPTSARRSLGLAVDCHGSPIRDTRRSLSDSPRSGRGRAGRGSREVFASGWLAGNGPTCRGASSSGFAALCGVAHALAISNCTAALHLALLALGAGPGRRGRRRPTTPSRPPGTRCCRPAPSRSSPTCGRTSGASTRRPSRPPSPPRTVGIIAVDPFGQPADYDELRAIADRHGLFLVEDAACAAGARTRAGPPAAWPTSAASASTAARGSPPARAAR